MASEHNDKRQAEAQAEIESIRQDLLQRKKRLWNEVRVDLEQDAMGTHQEVVNIIREEGEMGLEELREKNVIRLIKIKVDELEEIDSAITRIENGQYGICTDCEEQIPTARLKLIPYAVRCRECQEQQEAYKAVISPRDRL
jgi:DnaK suppressor protein